MKLLRLPIAIQLDIFNDSFSAIANN